MGIAVIPVSYTCRAIEIGRSRFQLLMARTAVTLVRPRKTRSLTSSVTYRTAFSPSGSASAAPATRSHRSGSGNRWTLLRADRNLALQSLIDQAQLIGCAPLNVTSTPAASVHWTNSCRRQAPERSRTSTRLVEISTRRAPPRSSVVSAASISLNRRARHSPASSSSSPRRSAGSRAPLYCQRAPARNLVIGTSRT